MRRLPSVQAKIDSELNKTLKDMEHSMFSREGENVVRQLTLPKHGLTEEQVMEQLKMYVGILLTCEVV